MHTNADMETHCNICGCPAPETTALSLGKPLCERHYRAATTVLRVSTRWRRSLPGITAPVVVGSFPNRDSARSANVRA